nr:uncharacterized protein LOC129435049 isoform X3 [Misgurnus anguillicaudatus]
MKPSIWQDMINTEFYRTNLLGIVVDEVHISYKLASALIMELSHLLRHQTSVQAAPAGPTAAPAGPTAAPAGPTAAPAGPTAAPAGPTAAPAGPTAAPAGPTAAPAGPTAAPAGPTAAPAGPTAAPAGPTAVPAGRLTAIPPGSITRLPGPTAGLPGPTTDLTGQTVRAPFLGMGQFSSHRPESVTASLSRLFQPYKGLKRKKNPSYPAMGAHIFLLLSNEYCRNTNAGRKHVLTGERAWEKKLRFDDVQCTPSDFINTIEEAFSALKMAGGFKLMRCGQSKQLFDIPIPPGGYSVEFLKNRSNLNKAVAYIVPLQCDLPLNANGQQNGNVENYTLKQICRTCNQEVPLHMLSSHRKQCNTSVTATMTSSGNITPKTVEANTCSMRICLMLSHQQMFNCQKAGWITAMDFLRGSPKRPLDSCSSYKTLLPEF